MKEIFDQYVETSFEGLSQATFKFAQFEKNYKSFFPTDTQASVLDIGIGRGEMLSTMKAWGFAASQGVDISPSTVRFCQSLGLQCQTVADTAEWLLTHPEQFSLITCLDVLEHVPRTDVIAFIKAAAQSLCPGGRLIIQVPNLQSPYGYLHHFNDFTHVSGFVEHSLAQVLLTAGLKKFKFFGFEELVYPSLKQQLRKCLRYLLRKSVRLMRRINGNPNPEILDPVFFAVVQK